MIFRHRLSISSTTRKVLSRETGKTASDQKNFEKKMMLFFSHVEMLVDENTSQVSCRLFVNFTDSRQSLVGSSEK